MGAAREAGLGSRVAIGWDVGAETRAQGQGPGLGVWWRGKGSILFASPSAY